MIKLQTNIPHKHRYPFITSAQLYMKCFAVPMQYGKKKKKKYLDGKGISKIVIKSTQHDYLHTKLYPKKVTRTSKFSKVARYKINKVFLHTIDYQKLKFENKIYNGIEKF